MNSKQSKTSTKNRSANRKRNRRRKARPSGNATLGSVHLAECTKDYLSAVVNPFKNYRTLPCIPDFQIMPSEKLVTKCRGTFATSNTTGVGWVMFNPFTMTISDAGLAGANCDFPIVSTLTTFTGTTAAFTVAAGAFTTVGVAGGVSNSPYNALFHANNNIRLRLVAAGLRVRYVGAPLYMQGVATLYRTGGNRALNSTEDVSNEMLKNNYAISTPVGRKTEFVFFTPSDIDITDYQSVTANQPTVGTDRRGCLTIFIEGGNVGNAQIWSYEAVAYFELIGQSLSLTPSHSDPVGYGAGLSSLPLSAPQESPESLLSKVLNKALDTVSNNVSGYVVNKLLPAAGNAAYNYLYPSLPQLPYHQSMSITEI